MEILVHHESRYLALPIAITPIRSSRRIAAQRGVFTIHGSDPDALDRLSRQNKGAKPQLRRLVIPRSRLTPIRQELAIAGISESLIFPELAGLCREIRAEFFGD